MSEFSIDFGKAKAALEQLNSLVKSMETKLVALDDAKSSVISMWEGPAREAFINAFNNDRGQMDEFIAGLKQYVSVLEADINNYIRAENSNVELGNSRSY